MGTVLGSQRSRFPALFTGTNHRFREQSASELPVSCGVKRVMATIHVHMLTHGAHPFKTQEANPLQYSHHLNSK
jgi:hypothetical protein